MNKRILIMILSAVAILLTAGCRRIDLVEQTSDLDLVFSTGAMETKGTAEEDAAALLNGDKFKNLLVVLVKDNGTNKTIYWDQRDFSVTNSGSVRFRNVKNDTYDVFAFANLSIDFTTDGSYWKGKSWEYVASVLANSGNVLDADGKLVISDTEKASIVNASAMLLTSKGQVTINGSSTGKILLQRPYARFRVEIRNNSDKKITLKELSFGEFKPSHTYLFSQTESGNPAVPSGTAYGTFAMTTIPAAGEVINSQTIKKNFFSTYLYESFDAAFATAEYEMYRMYATIALGDSYKSRLRFHLEWDSTTETQTITVSDAGTAVAPSGTSTSRWIYYDGEFIPLYEASTSGSVTVYEAIVDGFDLTKSFLISADGTSLDNGKWGGNGLKLKLGTAYTINSTTAKAIFLNSAEYLGGLDENDQPNGAVLKKIDLGGTNQATPIENLRRNQDFNIVLNVYSGSSEGDINIVVAEWNSGGGSHTFQ